MLNPLSFYHPGDEFGAVVSAVLVLACYLGVQPRNRASRVIVGGALAVAVFCLGYYCAIHWS